MHGRRIHVLLDDTPLTPDVKDSLDHLGVEAVVTSLSVDAPAAPSPDFDARLVLTDRPSALTEDRLRTLLAWCDRSPCATLILSKAAGFDAAIPPSDIGRRAIGFASDLSRDELAGRLWAMCSFRPAFDRVRGELDSAQRLNAAQRQQIGRLDDQLRSASTLQRSLRHMPVTVRGACVRSIYEPADALSGDICDVTRVDESRVCITLADVTGHGLTSAILAAHIRRSLRGDHQLTDPKGQVCPARILARANRELLESPPQDCQFVTAVVAVLDEDTQVLRWARGGAPYPILLRPGSAPADPACRLELLKSVGPLLGVIGDAHFEAAEVQLRPDDTVVFHTDGLDACLPETAATFCRHVLETQSNVSDPLDELIARIESRIALNERANEARLASARVGSSGESTHDDVSVVALRLTDREPTTHSPRESRTDSVRATVPA